MGQVERLIRRVPPDIPLVLTDVGVALALVVPNPDREATPAFTAARALLAVRLWGVLFLLVAAVLALATHQRWHGPCSLAARVLGAAVYTAWALSFLVSAVTSAGPYVGAVVFLFLAYRHTYPPVVR